MKAEPLKGKRSDGWQVVRFKGRPIKGVPVYHEEELHAAIKWLKEKVEKGSPSETPGFRPGEAHPHYYDMNPEEVLEVIDEAFQDVVDCRKGTR